MMSWRCTVISLLTFSCKRSSTHTCWSLFAVHTCRCYYGRRILIIVALSDINADCNVFICSIRYFTTKLSSWCCDTYHPMQTHNTTVSVSTKHITWHYSCPIWVVPITKNPRTVECLISSATLFEVSDAEQSIISFPNITDGNHTIIAVVDFVLWFQVYI